MKSLSKIIKTKFLPPLGVDGYIQYSINKINGFFTPSLKMKSGEFFSEMRNNVFWQDEIHLLDNIAKFSSQEEAREFCWKNYFNHLYEKGAKKAI